MKITIPVSKSDSDLLPLQTDALCHFGNLSQHEILLFPTQSAASAAYESAARLSGICPAVTVHPLPEFADGWPKASNSHWAAVVAHLDMTQNRSPWLWLEVDAVPRVPYWADALQQTYNQCGKPLMGAVTPTTFRAEDGTLFQDEDDLMLQGVAIYPSYLLQLKDIAPLFNNFSKGPYAPSAPFDVYLRWVFRRAGWHNTNLIDDQWNTHDYRMDAFLPIGEPIEDGRGRKRSGIVSAYAVLVHGCKDGSLHRLMVPQQQPVEDVIPVEPPEPKPHTVTEAAKPKAFLPVDRFPDTDSRFIIKRPTPEEEATWPCTKAEMIAFAKQKPRPRLRDFVAKFGIENNDAARRMLWHWGYNAPVPHTFIGPDKTQKQTKKK